MLAIIIFVMSFLCLFGISIVIPALPPGEIIQIFLGFSELTSPISEISGEVFTNALINGFFWGIIILIIYGLASSFSRKKTLIPVRMTEYPVLKKSTIEYVPPQTFVKKPAVVQSTSIEKFEQSLEGRLQHFKCPQCTGVFAVKKSKHNNKIP